MEASNTHTGSPHPALQFSLTALLAVPATFSLLWALGQFRATYPLIIPVLASFAGAAGALWADRRRESIAVGALCTSTAAGALYAIFTSVVRSASSESVHVHHDMYFLVALAILGATFAAPWGVVAGPLVARVLAKYRDRKRPSANESSPGVLLFQGASGGLLAAAGTNLIVTGSIVMSVYLWPAWLWGSTLGAIAGVAGRNTRFGPFYWGSVAGMLVVFAVYGVLRFNGVLFSPVII